MAIIPATPEDITPEWLTLVLRSAGEGQLTVAECRSSTVGEGVGFIGEIVRFRLIYDPPAPAAPQSLVAKMPSTHRQHDRYWGQPGRNAYEKELRFYGHIAPALPLRTPRCFFGEVDWEGRRSILLLEDMSRTRPGDDLAGGSARDAAIVARDCARFHAAFWTNARLDRVPDLPTFTAGFDNLQKRNEAAWIDYVDQFGEEMPEEVVAIGNSLLGEGGVKVRHRLAASPGTLCHGDFRLDNVFFLEPPAIAVIDWAGIRRGPGVWDLSNLVAQGLEPEVRRACEEAVVQTYHDTLVENGVSGYSLEQLQLDYRLSLLSHLHKLARGFASFEIANERHLQLTNAVRRRVASAVADNCGDDLF